MTHVALKDVTFAYDERPVLRHLTFALERGEFVGIVGPNGSGKSTLIDLIDGLQKPSSGEVLVSDRPTGAYRRLEMAREVALVPQHFDLGFDLSVREVVEMGSYCRDKDAVQCGDAGMTLARLGAAELEPRPFTELSGGERQLVVLAQALMQQAPLLLLDEPTAHLDAATAAQIRLALERLERKQTVVIASHDASLLPLAGRTIRLEEVLR